MSLGKVGEEAKTHRRVPRMTSSMDPAALDWLRLGTSGRRVRGGGFLRLADCAGRDSEEELCSRVRRGRGLLEVTTLEPGLWHGRSSGSLYGKEHNRWMMHFHLLPAGWTLCQTRCKDREQKHGTRRCPSFWQKVFTSKWWARTTRHLFIPIQRVKSGLEYTSMWCVTDFHFIYQFGTKAHWLEE